MKDSYCITVKEDASSFLVSVPRKVPLPLYQKTKEELGRMLETGVISRVGQPTDWCAPMVVTPETYWQGQGLCRPKQVEWVCQEGEPSTSSSRHNSQKIGRLQSVLKTWRELRILADKASMGIKTTDNIHHSTGPFLLQHVGLQDQFWFQEISEEYKSDPPGITWYGVQHRWRLEAVLVHLVEAGVTLNLDKCQFSTDRVKF